MSDIKVDFLQRDELCYELMCRAVVVKENETVDRMRKLLRSAIKNKLDYSYKNLNTKISLDSEVELIGQKVTQIDSSLTDLTSESRLQDIVRVENKLVHTKSRVDNLFKFKLTEEIRAELQGHLVMLNKYLEKLDALNVKSDLKEQLVRKVSDSNIELENLLDNIDSLALNPEPEHADVFLEENRRENVLDNSNLPVRMENPDIPKTSAFDSTLFNKLPNPIDRYLSALIVTNGLNIRELLTFINIMLKMKRETQLTDSQICQLLVGYCNAPLLDLFLRANRQGLSVSQVNQCILNTFIPYNMLDNLRRQYVNRPQMLNEPMSLYINSIKEHAEILRCNYSELEIVNIIKMGFNPETRSKLTFASDPKTVCDLNKLCIHANNITYSDHLRCSISQPQPVPAETTTQVNSVTQRTVHCFNCGRLGHIAKHCFGRKNQASILPATTTSHSKNM